jgi:hypothetical protein
MARIHGLVVIGRDFGGDTDASQRIGKYFCDQFVPF